MEIGAVLQSLGVDVLVVLAICLLTQVIKANATPAIKRWLIVIPVVIGIAAGVALNLGDGWLQAVRGGFIYGVAATWSYQFGAKFLGIHIPGDKATS